MIQKKYCYIEKIEDAKMRESISYLNNYVSRLWMDSKHNDTKEALMLLVRRANYELEQNYATIPDRLRV